MTLGEKPKEARKHGVPSLGAGAPCFFDSVNSFPLFLIDFKNLADIHFMIIFFGIIAFD